MPISRPIISAFLFLASIAIAVFFVFPKYKELSDVSQRLQAARDELSYLSEHYKKLEKLREELRQYDPVLKKIDDALPAKISLPALFAYLQNVTAQNGLILAEIKTPKLTPSSNNPQLKEADIKLPVIGSYDSLKNLLGSLYRNAKLIDISSISFSSPKEGELFDFEIGIKTYSY